MFEIRETWQVKEKMVSTLEKMHVQNGTVPDVLCWLSAPVAIVYGNLSKFGNNVKVGNNVANWCDH